jgi:predicted dehydrogenase
MGLRYIRTILEHHRADTQIAALCSISPESCAAAVQLFRDYGIEPPPYRLDFATFCADFAGQLDAALILTPHAFHHDQALACLDAGLDVLVEKPMVMSSAEAHSLIAARDRARRTLVVAFQGSLSPQVQTAVKLLRSGDLGDLCSISGTIWQNWREATAGTWRHDPAISGGGMCFDTGAHLLNTVCDLAGEPFASVSAWLDGTPVDTLGAVAGRLDSGALVTLHASGTTLGPRDSMIHVFCTDAILRAGAWGDRLDLQRRGRTHFRKVKVPAFTGPWDQFLRIRRGEIANPAPAENGLRMARLWEAIQASAAQDGVPVTIRR